MRSPNRRPTLGDGAGSGGGDTLRSWRAWAAMSKGHYSAEQIKREIERRRGEESDDEELSEAKLRADEYKALLEAAEEGLDSDFVCLHCATSPTVEAPISDVRKVTKLREVRAAPRGFTRSLTRPGRSRSSAPAPATHPAAGDRSDRRGVFLVPTLGSRRVGLSGLRAPQATGTQQAADAAAD